MPPSFLSKLSTFIVWRSVPVEIRGKVGSLTVFIRLVWAVFGFRKSGIGES